MHAQPAPLIYELYGVSNHIGGLGGGHYTAYAKHDKWYLFNDSRFDDVTNLRDIVSSEAYVLFYRLKTDASAVDEEDDDAGGGSSGGAGGGSAE
jgi:ubiquitin carboxyl-terminal hydrolase 4/11/15